MEIGEGEKHRGERGCFIGTTLFLPQIQVDVITMTAPMLTGSQCLQPWSIARV